MVNKINFIPSTENHLLLLQGKTWEQKWKIGRTGDQLAEAMINCAVSKATHEVLLKQFCVKIDTQGTVDIASVDEKIKKNIDFAERTISYLMEDHTKQEADPRVENIFGKFTKLNSGLGLLLAEKDHTSTQWGDRLETISEKKTLYKTSLNELCKQVHLNETNAALLIKARAQLDEITSQLLSTQPQSDHSALPASPIQNPINIGQDITIQQPDKQIVYTPIQTFIPQEKTTVPFSQRQPFHSLQQFMEYLSKHKDTPPSVEEFTKEITEALELLTVKSVFSTSTDPVALRNRIFYHLYHIHLKETPEKIDVKDLNYGANAFKNEKLSTASERLRAADRVHIELLFASLVAAIKSENNEEASQILATLEQKQIDPKDLPQKQKNRAPVNLAHSTFGKAYESYFKSWEENNKSGWKDAKTLPHPHDPCFHGDFGRNAFSMEGIPNHFKLEAVNSVLTSLLRDTWGIKF
jgi:hypothetical protein